MAFGIGKVVKKAWNGTVGKVWKEIDDYAIPVIGGAAIGALTGGLGVGAAALLGVESATAAAATTAAVSGGISGAVGGFSQGMAAVQAEKAADAAERAARQQEIMANAAPTTIQAPGSMTTHADTSGTNAGTQARRRYSVDKTTNSGMGLSRLGSSSSKKRKTLA